MAAIARLASSTTARCGFAQIFACPCFSRMQAVRKPRSGCLQGTCLRLSTTDNHAAAQWIAKLHLHGCEHRELNEEARAQEPLRSMELSAVRALLASCHWTDMTAAGINMSQINKGKPCLSQASAYARRGSCLSAERKRQFPSTGHQRSGSRHSNEHQHAATHPAGAAGALQAAGIRSGVDGGRCQRRQRYDARAAPAAWHGVRQYGPPWTAHGSQPHAQNAPCEPAVIRGLQVPDLPGCDCAPVPL